MLTNMPSIVDVLLKGVIIGIVVSAPMGPVGVLCIQRTLNKGRWYGFVTGVGATASDLIYALITGYGMSFVSDVLAKNVFYLQLFGSLLLMVFGIYTFRSNPLKSIRPTSHNKGTYVHNLVTAFFLTLSNPLIILLFIALYARFGFLSKNINVFDTVTGYAAIVMGALLWWFFITYAVNKVRKHFDLRGINKINKAIGSLVVVIAVVALVLTFTGSSLY